MRRPACLPEVWHPNASSPEHGDFFPGSGDSNHAAFRRSWTNLDDFAKEVNEARIADGVHYRFSTAAGVDTGHKVAALAVAKVPKSE